MTDPNVPPPLPDDALALVKRAGRVLPAPPGARARVLASVHAALGPPGGGGGPGGGARAPAVSSPAPAAVSSLLGRALPFAATFLIGAGVGAAIVRAAAHPAPETRIIYVDRPVAPPPAAPAASADPAIEELPATPPPVPAHAAAAPSAPARDALSAERVLLDRARMALERDDGADALAATAQHERRYPSGLLVQEREAMAIRALLLLRRPDDARARADRFRARFPQSVLLPTIEAAVQAPDTP